MSVLVQLLAAFAGSFGFALLFNTKIKHAVIGSVGGMCAWGLYMILEPHLHRVFFICLFASVFAALFGEICARMFKAPVTVFFIIAVIPLIPGSMLYRTISNVVISSWANVQKYGLLTAEYAFSIAIGASFVWGSRRIIARILKKRKKIAQKQE